jgi:hypothetical protein
MRRVGYEDEIERFQAAYWMYYLALERLLPLISLIERWRNTVYFARREHQRGNFVPYTPSDRKLAERYNKSAKYLEFDFINLILHCRIVVDRIAGLSRSFLMVQKQELPSFTSFAEHRKFFMRLTRHYGVHEEYAEYIRSHTEWFVVLKTIRDKFLVHVGPRHRKMWLLPGFSDRDIALMVLQDPKENPERLQVLSIQWLIEEVDVFLRWFSDYGTKSLGDRKKRMRKSAPDPSR